MTFSNVKLILAREVRDQLRDRRTLFVIAVLPVVLYPLLGMSLFQIAQFTQEQKARVLVVGAGKLAASPPLFEGGRFAAWLFSDAKGAELLELHFAPHEPPDGPSASDLRADARAQVQLGAYEAAVFFPPDFAIRLDAFRKAIGDRRVGQTANESQKTAVVTGKRPATAVAGGKGRDTSPRDRSRGAFAQVPSPEIIYNTTKDKSQVAFARLSEVLMRWSAWLRPQPSKSMTET